MNPFFDALGDLQFLRPAWLLALLLLPVLAWTWRRGQRRRSAWRQAVDPHLLPHLLSERPEGARAAFAGLPVLAGLTLAVIAMAGPSWRGVPQPLQGGAAALAIVLDLSSATLANDLQPSRLAQARAKIAGLLASHAGDVALSYADDAFVVSPVTPDPDNVAVLRCAWRPTVPVDGDRPAAGIVLARELLAQAGHARGDILLLAPGGDQAAVRPRRLRRPRATACRAGMGTAAGAGYRGRDGGIHRSVLDAGSLQALATAGGGRVHPWETPAGEVLAATGGEAGSGSGSTASGPTDTPTGSVAAAEAAGQMVREDGGYCCCRGDVPALPRSAAAARSPVLLLFLVLPVSRCLRRRRPPRKPPR